MYVDDIVGVSERSELQHDLDPERGVCTKLLGDHAVQDDKTVFTTREVRRLDVIGYIIDLEKQVVTISRRNLLKNMYLFFSIDTDQAVTVATMETIAALASRYSMICREMRPFSKALHGSFKGLINKRVSFMLKADAIRSIEMWRAMLCMLAFDEAQFARPFESFGARTANITVQFDASLEGAGFVIYGRHSLSGVESILGASVVPLLSLEFGDDSGYQNTSEFLAATIGILTCLRIADDDGSHVVIDLKGDSVSALQWANTSRFNSESVHRAAILFTLLLVRQKVVITGVEHVAGEHNGICDDLSRRDTTGSFRTAEQVVPGVTDFRAADD